MSVGADDEAARDFKSELNVFCLRRFGAAPRYSAREAPAAAPHRPRWHATLRLPDGRRTELAVESVPGRKRDAEQAVARLACAALAAAGHGDTGHADVGSLDAGDADVGSLDTGNADAGSADTGTADAHRPRADVARADAGHPHAAAARLGAGQPDAGSADAVHGVSRPARLSLARVPRLAHAALASEAARVFVDTDNVAFVRAELVAAFPWARFVQFVSFGKQLAFVNDACDTCANCAMRSAPAAGPGARRGRASLCKHRRLTCCAAIPICVLPGARRGRRHAAVCGGALRRPAARQRRVCAGR